VPPVHFTNTGVRINAEIPWINKTNLTSARFQSGAAALNGKVYLAGGINSSGTLFNAFQVFNPSTNAWTTLATLPASICALTLVESGGKLYAIGGRDGSNVKNTVYRYDTSANTWSTMTAMTTARCALSGVASNGKIYVFGGCTNLSNTMTAATEIYDIAGNSWSSGTSMPTAKASFTASLVSGKVYLIGGATASGVYTAANDVYNISGNSWTSGRAMQRVREGYGSVVSNGLIYLFGGYRASYIADCEQYDPVSDTYANILSSNYSRAFPASATVGGKAYLMGGEDGTFSYTINEEYTIPTTLFAIQKDP
jgi:N-acetylneuraminic acid mutarotase